jgi:hypothetical protein
MSLVALWSAYHFWRVGSTVSDDLAAMAEYTQLNVNAAGFRGRLPEALPSK